MQYFVRNRRRLKPPTAATPPIAAPPVPVVPVEQDEQSTVTRDRVIVSG